MYPTGDTIVNLLDASCPESNLRGIGRGGVSAALVDWTDQSKLRMLDSSGYEFLRAVALSRLYSPSVWTLSKPHPFECDDGHIYWCKGNSVEAPVQGGLAAELIAGRFADRLGVGGPSEIIHVDEDLAPPDGSARNLVGFVAGSRHREGMANARSWIEIMGTSRFAATLIDPLDRAKVVAFQTWLGAEDAQVLVDYLDRKLLSIDHGGCFTQIDRFAHELDVVATYVPGTDADLGRQVPFVERAVCEIESISDETLLATLSCIPDGPRWDAGIDRRLAIGAWLAHRRDHLRPALYKWAIGP